MSGSRIWTFSGEATDLNGFLFGSERIDLAVVRPVLLDIQNRHCFYCRSPLTPTNTHVDHFVAWARYPVDLGHNFALADNKCNQQKRDCLLACEHLAAWMDRNAKFSDQIGEALKQRGIVSEHVASNCVAQWAYAQTEAAHGLTWLRKDQMVPPQADWRKCVPATAHQLWSEKKSASASTPDDAILRRRCFTPPCDSPTSQTAMAPCQP